MDGTLGLLGNRAGAGGGGVPSGGSTTAGSILTVSKEENNKNNMVMSAEVSSYPDDDDDADGSADDSDELELGLGLSIGGGLKSKTAAATAAAPCWGQYGRILTAKDFPSLISKQPNPSSSSSSVNIPNSSTSGTKRTATDSVSPPNGNSVVGWPPIRRAHRMPSFVNQTRSSNEELSSLSEERKGTNNIKGSNKNNYSQEKKGVVNKNYLSVKVNMDGTLIGRKVDLNAHSSYEMLAQTLEDMFCGRWSSTEVAGPSKLLDGTSEFVLTYEDKDGDWMLVGDVPWEMFLGSVKRLRIMRNSESNELAPRFQEKNGQRRTNAI